MYEQYSNEIKAKINELGLWGKTPKEIIKEAIKSCNKMGGNEQINSMEIKQALNEIEAFLYEYYKTMK